MKRLIALTVLVVLLASRPAHAYLDPGTGSLLVQGLLAAIAAAAAAIAASWTRIVRFLTGRGRPGRSVDAGEADSNRS